MKLNVNKLRTDSYAIFDENIFLDFLIPFHGPEVVFCGLLLVGPCWKKRNEKGIQKSIPK